MTNLDTLGWTVILFESAMVVMVGLTGVYGIQGPSLRVALSSLDRVVLE